MKKNDFKPGTRVLASINDEEYGDNEMTKYVYDSYGYITITGTVLDKPSKPGRVFVAWDESDFNIDFEEDVEIKLLTLETDKSDIEKDFKSVAKQVREKVKQAAALVREANKLAQKGHAKNLESMGANELISAMDDSGWRSSSWGC
jgi:predicted DNA-binding helix-hairpin-helix protein